ncbi:TPA: DUF6680 family protein [Vibrio parahaemolyticus]|nr:hypothetical protein [Vibrio parahaemolyticus]MBE4323105.1 hypothetical protein [Vibrio parahaemolyticus]MBE4341291.1 hypothetical protein [Vibrio parahaemolyticus]
MENSTILATLIASLLSGLIGVFVSFIFYSRLEKRKLKLDTARRLIGNRFNISSPEFQQAMNEIFIVFADSKKVIAAMDDFWQVVQTPISQRAPQLADDKLITLLKAVCKDVGIAHKDLNDAYYLRFFSVPKK